MADNAFAREYYILVPTDRTSFPGHPIYTDKDGRARVKMTPKQAQFFIDQGALSLNPPSSNAASEPKKLKRRK